MRGDRSRRGVARSDLDIETFAHCRRWTHCASFMRIVHVCVGGFFFVGFCELLLSVSSLIP